MQAVRLVCVSKSTTELLQSYVYASRMHRVYFEIYQTRPKSITATPPYMAQYESVEQQT